MFHFVSVSVQELTVCGWAYQTSVPLCFVSVQEMTAFVIGWTCQICVPLCLVSVQERLAHLKRQCQPHLTEVAQSSVEGLCLKWYHGCCYIARMVQEMGNQILKDQGITGMCVLI